MANHGFILLRTRIDGKRLLKELLQISESRFQGRVKVNGCSNGWDGKPTFDIEVYTAKGGFSVECLFWLANPKKIEHRHGPGGDFRHWIESVFANDLAYNLNGRLGDEVFEEKWVPKNNKFPTFLSFLEDRWSWTKKGDISIARFFIKQSMYEAEKTRPDLVEFMH